MNLVCYIDILANLIITNYYQNSNCLLIFTDANNSVNYNGKMGTVRITASNRTQIPEHIIFHYFGCQGIIIKSNHPLQLFASFEQKIRLTKKDRFNNRRYLLLPGDDISENFTNISTMDELDYISDLIIVDPDKNDNKIIYLKTHKYIGPNSSQLEAIDTYFGINESFLYETNLFPNKLSNQQGRGIRLATFPYEPYSVLDGTGNYFLGSELLTALEFVRYLNATPIMVVDEKDQWGEIFPNWTGNGIMGNLVEDDADIGFGALYTWEDDYKYLDLSKPLVRTGITCLVPAPKLTAGWKTMFFSFSIKMWMVVAGSFLFCVFTLFLMNSYYLHRTQTNYKYSIIVYYLTTLEKSIFTISKLLILQNLTRFEKPTRKLQRYFMGFVFVLSLFLTSTYSSGLSSIMTIPRYDNPINTVADFVKSDIYWGATSDAWKTSMETAQEEQPQFTVILSRFIAGSKENLRQYSLRGDFAFSIERLPKGNYAIGTYITNETIKNYHLMKEDFYWEQCIFMLRKNSVLLPLVDLFILRAFEAGLISFWQNEAVALYMDSSVQRIVNYYAHHTQEKTVVKLKWIHVEGAFVLLLFGYLISAIVFIMELIKGKFMKNEKLQYIE